MVHSHCRTVSTQRRRPTRKFTAAAWTDWEWLLEECFAFQAAGLATLMRDQISGQRSERRYQVKGVKGDIRSKEWKEISGQRSERRYQVKGVKGDIDIRSKECNELNRLVKFGTSKSISSYYWWEEYTEYTDFTTQSSKVKSAELSQLPVWCYTL